MAIIEESIDIKCPVDKVFAYTTDVKSWSKWQSTVTEAEQTSPGQMGIGTTFKWTIHGGMGLTTKWTAKVTEYEPNKMWSKNEVTGSSVMESRLSFGPIEGGTKFTLRYDMKIGGFFKLFSPMLVSSTRKSMKVALNNIKSILEAQT
jgi:uncharacterized membrane protein